MLARVPTPNWQVNGGICPDVRGALGWRALVYFFERLDLRQRDLFLRA